MVRMKLPYTAVCVLLGLVIAWIPMLLHGPIPEKFNVLYIRGAVAVWSWYTARMLIGLWVGITCWPRRWYVRGPLCGFLALLPSGIMSLSIPTCGPPCMAANESTATVAGLLIAGLAFLITGKHHARDEPDDGARSV